MLGVDIRIGPNVVLISPRGRAGKNKNASWEVLCVAAIMRGAMVFATGHAVSSRAVWNSQGKFVTYVCFVYAPFMEVELSSNTVKQERIFSLSHLRLTGWQIDAPFDFINKFKESARMESIKQHFPRAVEWRWRVKPHRNSRD